MNHTIRPWRALLAVMLSAFSATALPGPITDRVDTRLGTTTLWTPDD